MPKTKHINIAQSGPFSKSTFPPPSHPPPVWYNAVKGGVNMVDIEKLRQAVTTYTHQASPISANSSTPATVGDINNLVSETVKVLTCFINELEKNT